MALIGAASRWCSFSRPRLTVVTSPAASSTARCLETDWRAMSSPAQSSRSVCPPRAFRSSSRRRRPGAARGLNTASSRPGSAKAVIWLHEYRQPRGCMSSDLEPPYAGQVGEEVDLDDPAVGDGEAGDREGLATWAHRHGAGGPVDHRRADGAREAAGPPPAPGGPRGGAARLPPPPGRAAGGTPDPPPVGGGSPAPRVAPPRGGGGAGPHPP